jgi:hypothetical protein
MPVADDKCVATTSGAPTEAPTDAPTTLPTKASTDAPTALTTKASNCQFADGTPGTKCDGSQACEGIDTSKVGCGSCNGIDACVFSLTDNNSQVFVGENSCNGVFACSGHIQGVQSGNNVVIGKGSW